MLDAEMLVNQPVLRHHHVADSEPGKYAASRRRSVRGGGRHPIGEGVDYHHVELRGIQDRIRSKERHPLVGPAQKPGWDQDGIVPGRVDLAEHAISQSTIGNDRAAAERA